MGKAKGWTSLSRQRRRAWFSLTPRQGSRSRGQGNRATWQPYRWFLRTAVSSSKRASGEAQFKTDFICESQNILAVLWKGQKRQLSPSQLLPQDKKRSYNTGLWEPVTEIHSKICRVTQRANLER